MFRFTQGVICLSVWIRTIQTNWENWIVCPKLFSRRYTHALSGCAGYAFALVVTITSASPASRSSPLSAHSSWGLEGLKLECCMPAVHTCHFSPSVYWSIPVFGLSIIFHHIVLCFASKIFWIISTITCLWFCLRVLGPKTQALKAKRATLPSEIAPNSTSLICQDAFQWSQWLIENVMSAYDQITGMNWRLDSWIEKYFDYFWLASGCQWCRSFSPFHFVLLLILLSVSNVAMKCHEKIKNRPEEKKIKKKHIQV